VPVVIIPADTDWYSHARYNDQLITRTSMQEVFYCSHYLDDLLRTLLQQLRNNVARVLGNK